MLLLQFKSKILRISVSTENKKSNPLQIRLPKFNLQNTTALNEAKDAFVTLQQNNKLDVTKANVKPESIKQRIC